MRKWKKGITTDENRAEDRTLQEGERVVLGRSSVLTDNREAPSYASYLTLMSSYLLAYVGSASAIYTKANDCERKTYEVCECAMSVCYR